MILKAMTTDPSRIAINDVLLGRGGATNNHEGNKRYRTIVSFHQPEYLIARKKDKALISKRIVAIVKANGGRFLRRDASSRWVEIPDKKAIEKTSQALREGLDVRNHTVRPQKQVRRHLSLNEESTNNNNNNNNNNNMSWTYIFAALYVGSGICQPLLMTVCSHAGLANSTAQLYMFFYYLGPALTICTVGNERLPSRKAVLQACAIALFDIGSQALNYTGAGLAGSTIFAVIYSSVTVWTAVWSRCVLGRKLNHTQWTAVWIVFGGLTLTALDTQHMGQNVKTGATLVVVGSAMHAGSYVFSEAILTDESLSVRQNTGIQALLATVFLGIWQCIYTLPRWQTVLAEPVRAAGSTATLATLILVGFGLTNLVHANSFYYTLKHYPGGATSAGVMKGLQAVLVFIATDLLYCGRIGGKEMCFSTHKFVSLVTVVTGVLLFAVATEQVQHEQSSKKQLKSSLAQGENSPLLAVTHNSEVRWNDPNRGGVATVV